MKYFNPINFTFRSNRLKAAITSPYKVDRARGKQRNKNKRPDDIDSETHKEHDERDLDLFRKIKRWDNCDRSTQNKYS